MNKLMRTLFYIRMASFASVLGTGMTWTGLGYTLTILYNDPRYMGLLQTLAVISSLLSPYFAIKCQDKLKIRTIMIGSDILSVICYLLIFILISFNQNIHILPVLIIGLSMISTLALSIQSIYFEPLYAQLSTQDTSNNKDLTSHFSKLGSLTTLGKLLGMGCGPIFFEFIGFKAIFINCITFIFSAVFINEGTKNSSLINDLNKFKKNNLNLIHDSKGFLENSSFIENIIASSLIYIVVLILSIRLADQNASAMELSVYWFGATFCAFIVQTILSKENKWGVYLRHFDSKFGYLAAIPVLIGLIFNNIIGIILCQFVFSFINPIARNTAKARFYENFGNNEETITAYSFRDFYSQLMILLFSMAMSFFYSNFFYVVISFVLTLLVVLRWFFSKNTFFKENRISD